MWKKRGAKKICGILTVLLALCLLASCPTPEDPVLASLGEYGKYEYYFEGAFQDSTDYAKYYYDRVPAFDSGYFSRIGESRGELDELLDDFERWIATYRESGRSCELVARYAFDRMLIDGEDYLYLTREDYTFDDGEVLLGSYDIYFFDVQTNVLYYFHNNV